MSTPDRAPVVTELEKTAWRAAEIARARGRIDLEERVAKVPVQLMNTEVRVVVVGQFKQGKSALVNALVNAPVCPVDDVVATAVPTVVRWGKTVGAQLVTEIANDATVLRTDIQPTELRQHVTDLAAEQGLLGSLRAEVSLPAALLAEGLVLIDTPGVGRAEARAANNLALLPQADAALMVSDATQEFTQPEISFVRSAAQLTPNITAVLSKIDLQYDWRSIAETNAAHLTQAGVDMPIVPTSALLAGIGAAEQDADLVAEARIDELVDHLRGAVRDRVLADRHLAAANEIIAACEHLSFAAEAEHDALTASEQPERVVQSLSQAEDLAARLSQRSARWQQTLSDGAGELVADIEFDLRDRLRVVGREAEQLIDASDPGQSWEDIGGWLAESVTQAVSDNFVWAHQRSVHLAEVVAKHFALDGRAAVPKLTVTGASQVMHAIGGLEYIRSGKLSVGQKLMIGMKGSYGGVLMFGLMTTLAGMALVNPISIAAGLIMGGVAYRQEAQQRLEQRRGEAKVAVRKLIDEAIFQVGKESRDRMGRVKRTLRDHFITVAEDLKRSLNESIRAAERSSALPPSAREQRLAEVTAELNELRTLSEAARTLTQPNPTLERRAA